MLRLDTEFWKSFDLGFSSYDWHQVDDMTDEERAKMDRFLSRKAAEYLRFQRDKGTAIGDVINGLS